MWPHIYRRGPDLSNHARVAARNTVSSGRVYRPKMQHCAIRDSPDPRNRLYWGKNTKQKREADEQTTGRPDGDPRSVVLWRGRLRYGAAQPRQRLRDPRGAARIRARLCDIG